MKKRFLALMLVGVMALSLAACGNNNDTGTTQEDTAAEDTSADETADEDEGAEEAADSSEGKVYEVATDTTFAPFEFENESGDMVGIDMDLLAAIAEDQGFEYTLQVVGFSAAVTALETGQCDAVIAGMSITDEREEKYDFTDPYYDSGVGMGVLSDSDIATYADLEGLQVAAKVGTEGCTFAESIADEYGFTVVQFEDSSTMYQDVLAGNSAACFEDYPVLGYEISRGMDLKIPTDMEAGNSYGLAVLKGDNAELLEMFNAGLQNLKDSGKYDEILDSYISR